MLPTAHAVSPPLLTSTLPHSSSTPLRRPDHRCRTPRCWSPDPRWRSDPPLLVLAVVALAPRCVPPRAIAPDASAGGCSWKHSALGGSTLSVDASKGAWVIAIFSLRHTYTTNRMCHRTCAVSTTCTPYTSAFLKFHTQPTTCATVPVLSHLYCTVLYCTAPVGVPVGVPRR